MDKSADIESRAKELAAWNPTSTLDWAYQAARAEAAAGTLPSYTPIAIAQRRVDTVKRDIGTAENAPRYDAVFIAELYVQLVAAKQALLALRSADQSLAAE